MSVPSRFGLALLVLCSCQPVEDVCTGRDESACLSEACVFEAGSETCLQTCRDSSGCPEGMVCVEDDLLDHCRDGETCLAVAINEDLCRPE